MALVPIQSNSDAYTQAMDERHYNYHEHHHDHYYHHEEDQQHGSGTHSKSNELSTNQNHHHNHQNHLKPIYQVYCRANYNYALTIRDGKVILAPSNPSDPHQHWYKEEKFKTQVKDAIGLPSFALVNKATKQAIKHPIAAAQPLKLIQYKADNLDCSILWCEASITNDGDYKAIRMVNNVGLNMDAFDGIQKNVGVHDGTIVGVYGWNGGNHQRWKIVPY